MGLVPGQAVRPAQVTFVRDWHNLRVGWFFACVVPGGARVRQRPQSGFFPQTASRIGADCWNRASRPDPSGNPGGRNGVPCAVLGESD